MTATTLRFAPLAALTLTAVTLTAVAFAACPGFAQEPNAADVPPAETEPAAEAAAEPPERIVITGQRPQGLTPFDYAHEFVLEIGDPPSSNYGYARWDGRICLGVVGAAAEGAEYIADRLGELGVELGLRPRGPGCRPNIVILFAPDGAGLARELVDRDPHRFRPFDGVGGTTQGLAALEEFTASDAPVRWWTITMTVDFAGNIAMELPPRYGRYEPPRTRGSNSHITNGVRDEMVAAYIIVEQPKVEGRTWAQLADYLAMVAFAQIDPAARPASYDSILNLFDAAAPPVGMTEWDHAYLQALYSISLHREPQHQRGALARAIAREQRRAGEAE
jgi:hypothetical protein